MTNPASNPYILRWSRQQYEKVGRELGFRFSRHEFEQARENDCVLGVRRYLPVSKSALKLAIPPGAYVQCCLHDD